VLCTTGTEQGRDYGLSLNTGKTIKRYAWMESPMPNEAIEQVKRLADMAEI